MSEPHFDPGSDGCADLPALPRLKCDPLTADLLPKDAFSESVGHLLTKVSVSMSGAASQLLMARLGITAKQANVVHLLAHRRTTTTADVARELGIDDGAATRLIDRLQKRNLLSRERALATGRAVPLALTPRGFEAATIIPCCFAQVLDACLTGIAPADVVLLRKMLGQILANAESSLTRPAPTAVPMSGPIG